MSEGKLILPAGRMKVIEQIELWQERLKMQKEAAEGDALTKEYREIRAARAEWDKRPRVKCEPSSNWDPARLGPDLALLTGLALPFPVCVHSGTMGMFLATILLLVFRFSTKRSIT